MNCDLDLITLLSGEKEPPGRIPGDVAFERQKLSISTTKSRRVSFWVTGTSCHPCDQMGIDVGHGAGGGAYS